MIKAIDLSRIRDGLGFLPRRVVKLRPPPVSARWMKIGMVACWVGAFVLAWVVTAGWLL